MYSHQEAAEIGYQEIHGFETIQTYKIKKEILALVRDFFSSLSFTRALESK